MNRKKPLSHCLVRFVVLLAGLMAVSAATAASQGVNTITNFDKLQTDRLIVKFSQEVTDNTQTAMDRHALAANDKKDLAASLTRNTGLKLRYKRTIATGADVFVLDRRRPNDELAAIAAQLAADGAIEYAEPDRLMQPLLTPNDTRYNEQWHYFEATGGLNLPSAWDSNTGSGAVVAVIDTGYRPHADLVANQLPGYDMISDTFVSRDGNGRDSDASDPGDYTSPNDCYSGWPGSSSSWHGTHVAGTVAAVTNNGNGVAGVAFGAKVVPVRVLGRCGGYTSDIADGMIWASGGSVSGVPANANPAQALNLSLGGSGACSSTTQSAINTARATGAVVVVAAGNSNTNASNANPANCNGVITVAATDRSGNRAYYSNYGNVVDVAAPGGETNAGSSNGVLSTLNTGSTTPGSDTYAFYQGTSMATPHVAGLAALIASVNPSLTPDQVESTITSTARSFPGSCSQCGSGIADATAAIAAAGGGGGGPGAGELANGVPETGLSASTGAELRYSLEVPAGATNLSFSISGGSGDADLYVSFGAEPTTSSYDCRPYLNGNNETCDIATAQAGTYHVMVRAYSTFSGVSLVGSFDEGGGPPVEGGSASVDDISAGRRKWSRFTIDIPAGMSSLEFTISGGTGDADLYVRYGSQPSTSNYDCRPYLSGNNETCSFSSPQAGIWHIGIRGYTAYSGVDLYVEWNP